MSPGNSGVSYRDSGGHTVAVSAMSTHIKTLVTWRKPTLHPDVGYDDA